MKRKIKIFCGILIAISFIYSIGITIAWINAEKRLTKPVNRKIDFEPIEEQIRALQGRVLKSEPFDANDGVVSDERVAVLQQYPPPRVAVLQQPLEQNPTTSPKWITISYLDLLDKNAITHTGETVGAALQDTRNRGIVQPFVDKYSYLLQQSIEMTFGRDPTPYRNVIDFYPIATKQPAWVAIFHNGRIFATTDSNSHARFFLLGDNPETAYKTHYSLIRHCLRAMLPADGSNLVVEVFAYKNNYQSSELELNLEPYILKASSFSAPKGTVPLDLAGLEDFFNKKGQLEGAKLDAGLILYAQKIGDETLAGHPVSLADFAVAYRAAFHAGDNDAFISLDPHKDPTKVTVNFGGFLEDTRIGAVVLQADKRFKTITSGLDPTSFEDYRSYSRKFMPTFLTGAERDLVDKVDAAAESKWIGTRFWFYPESVEVESDFDYKYARITNPQFTADAERSKDDFASPEEFEKKKKEKLSPSIRNNIQHLNQNYSQYAEAYPELRELKTVGRLMAICSWLRKANATWLDLDALLSVELPAFSTEREKTQLVATSLVAYTERDSLDEIYVKNNSIVVFLSPILDKTVREYFVSPSNIAKFLCCRNNIHEDAATTFQAKATDIMAINGEKQVREIIETKKDLEALAEYASDNIESPPAPIAEKWEAEIDKGKSDLDKMDQEIGSLKARMVDSDSDELYDLHNRLVDQYNSRLSEVKADIAFYNQLHVFGTSVVEIGGGINLEPQNFNVKRTSTSLKLEAFKGITEKAGVDWQIMDDSQNWVKSRNQSGGYDYRNSLPKLNFVRTVNKQADTTFEHVSASDSFVFNGKTIVRAGTNQDYWASTTGQADSWRDLLKVDKSVYRERMFNKAENVLHVSEYESGMLKNYIIGKKVSENRIVFSKSTRQDLMKPQEPPVWWIKVEELHLVPAKKMEEWHPIPVKKVEELHPTPAKAEPPDLIPATEVPQKKKLSELDLIPAIEPPQNEH